jgi:hypothetical protein
MSEDRSRVFLNPDGYVELVLIGSEDAAGIRRLVDEVIDLLEKHGPIGGLIDGRNGNIIRNLESLNILRSLQMPKLRRLIILTTDDNPIGIAGPSVVMSIFTLIFGFRPVYTNDEVRGRELAAS